ASISYRRVFVPEDALDQQIRGLLPLKRDELERRLVLANLAADAAANHEAARIDEATYQARLTPEGLLEGSARLIVKTPAASAALLSLEPCQLAIRSAIWSDGDGEPAVLGTDSAGK